MCNCHISLTNGESHGESSHAKNQIFQIISLIITSSTVSQYKNPKNIWLFLDLFFQKSQIYIGQILKKISSKLRENLSPISGKSWDNHWQILGKFSANLRCISESQVSFKTKCDFTHLVVPRTCFYHGIVPVRK